MYDSSIPFTADEINLIEQAGLTIAELRDFYTRFPDQDLATAIGGCLDEKKHKAEGATIPLDSSLQETVTTTIQPETEPVVATTDDSKLPEDPASTL